MYVGIIIIILYIVIYGRRHAKTNLRAFTTSADPYNLHTHATWLGYALSGNKSIKDSRYLLKLYPFRSFVMAAQTDNYLHLL